MTVFNGSRSSIWRSRKFLYGITDWALLVAGLANLIVGTVAALNNSATIAATSLTAGLVLLLAATIDRFESLKGLGIEAKTKQLDEKIVQADEVLRRLREMGEVTCEALIDVQSRLGRWDSAPTPRESIAFADRIREIVKNLGLDERAVGRVLCPWAKELCLEMAFLQFRGVSKLLDARLKELESQKEEKFHMSQPEEFPLILKEIETRILAIKEFQRSKNHQIASLDLEDYPGRFMEIFDHIPEIDLNKINELRSQAERFIPGMTSLRQSRTLSEPELWIAELNKSRRPT